MYCKLGHRAEKIVISDQRFRKVAHCEYDVDMSGSGGTNKRMKGANSAVVNDNSRVEFSDLEARAR